MCGSKVLIATFKASVEGLSIFIVTPASECEGYCDPVSRRRGFEHLHCDHLSQFGGSYDPVS